MSRVAKCVIPAAGLGTRLVPATRAVPKPLLPVIGPDGRCAPVIQLVAAEALAAGIEEVALIVAPAAEPLFRRHFLEGPRPSDLAALGERITLIVQPEPAGFGDAVRRAAGWVGGQPCLLLLADQLFLSHTAVPCARQLLDLFAWRGASAVGVAARPSRDAGRYGVVRGRPVPGRERVYELERIVEKPAPEEIARDLATPDLPPEQCLVLFGCYALTPLVFELLEHEAGARRAGPAAAELGLTAALDELRRIEGFAALRIEGDFYDTGTPESYREAFTALAP